MQAQGSRLLSAPRAAPAACRPRRAAGRRAARPCIAGLPSGGRGGYERVLRYPDGRVSSLCQLRPFHRTA